MSLAVAVAFALTCGGARAEVGDINCSATRERLVTRVYCRAQAWADKVVEPRLSRWGSSFALGWCLVFFYHGVAFAQAHAKGIHGMPEGTPFLPLARKRATIVGDYARLCRLLGQQLLVYWAYFGAAQEKWALLRDDPFLHSLALICVDNVVLYVTRECLEAYSLDQGQRQSPLHQPAGRARPTTIFHLRTVYALPGGSSLQDTLTWLTQTTLFVLYFVWMIDCQSTIQAPPGHDTLIWAFGVLAICTVGEQQAGETFAPAVWRRVVLLPISREWKGNAMSIWSIASREDFVKWILNWIAVLIAMWRAIGRCFLDCSVNFLYRQVLLCTTPILLCTTGPIDFVKDIIALVFITTLDDPTDARRNDSREKICEFINVRKPRYLSDQQRELAGQNKGDELVDGLEPELAAKVWIDMFGSLYENHYGLVNFCWDLLRSLCCRHAAQPGSAGDGEGDGGNGECYSKKHE